MFFKKSRDMIIKVVEELRQNIGKNEHTFFRKSYGKYSTYLMHDDMKDICNVGYSLPGLVINMIYSDRQLLMDKSLGISGSSSYGININYANSSKEVCVDGPHILYHDTKMPS